MNVDVRCIEHVFGASPILALVNWALGRSCRPACRLDLWGAFGGAD